MAGGGEEGEEAAGCDDKNKNPTIECGEKTQHQTSKHTKNKRKKSPCVAVHPWQHTGQLRIMYDPIEAIAGARPRPLLVHGWILEETGTEEVGDGLKLQVKGKRNPFKRKKEKKLKRPRNGH